MRRADPVAGAATRRGMVLGLTLAEIMLLLTFCLVMASAAGLTHERDLRREAEARRDEAVAEANLKGGAGAVRGLVEAEARRTGSDPDDLWRRLVAEETRAPPARAARADGTAVTGEAPGEGAAARPPVPGAEAPAAARDDAAPGRAQPAAAAPPAKGVLGKAADVLANIGRSLTGTHDWPPIVTLSEAGGFRFASGSSNLSPAFQSRLRDGVVPKLAGTGRAYDVDVIEVIGHTDGQPVTGAGSNLDGTLLDALKGHLDPGRLQAADNAGLGLARAATVAAALRRDPRLDGYRIVPLSAGQAVGVDDRPGVPGGPDPTLRRIEIRMRKGVPLGG